MAFKSKLMLLFIVAILVLGLVIKEDPSASQSQRYQNRKVLAKGMKQLSAAASGGTVGDTRGSMNSQTNGSEKVLEAVRELRIVPSGPNPLHHHGGGPVKPQTP